MISSVVIRRRLKKAEKIGITGRNKVGKVLRNAFYSESDVRSACADLLKPIPHADKNGFFILSGERYGTLKALSKKLNVSMTAITDRIKTHNLQSIQGKDNCGHVCNFYCESFIREICADLLQTLPRSDEKGFFIKDGVKYGTLYAWSKVLGISQCAVESRFKIHKPEGIKGKDKVGRICNFFSEDTIREICSDLLQPLPQADENGFFIKDGESYGTLEAWTKVLGISRTPILIRIKTANLQGIKGKDIGGNVRNFFSESAIRQICADLLQDIPQADEEGFFEKDGQMYVTIGAFSKRIGIPTITIKYRIKIHNPPNIKGKNTSGQVCVFYPESAIRKICADLLQDIPQADESGFFMKDGEKYGTIPALSSVLGISNKPISDRIKAHNLLGIKGKDNGGHVHNFYPEVIIRKICADLLESCPQADEEGFFIKDGERYGTILTWSKEFGISMSAIVKSRLKGNKQKSIKGKNRCGQIYDFYTESLIREICADLIQTLPQADESGFFMKDGNKYGTIGAWENELGISYDAILARIKRHKLQGINGKIKCGRICDFYPESAIRQTCADLLQDILQADEEGFFVKDGQKYSTIRTWSNTLGISQNAISLRIKTHNPKNIKGKVIGGQIYDFYPESVIREICADLLAKKKNS